MLLNLPDLPREKIFNFLNIPDRLRARRVCKAWKLVIESLYLPQNLCIYFAGCPKGDEWLDCNRKRITNDQLLQFKFNFKLNSESPGSFGMKFFPNLQCLYLYKIGVIKLDFFLERTDQLTQLRVLMIYGEQIYITKKVSSSSLESLSIKYLGHNTPIQLDTPNLSSLVLWFWSRWANNELSIRFPLTIKRLECTHFNPALSQLKSLETLICLQIIWMDFKLEDFKFLNRLEIWPSDEEELELVRQIQKERDASKRSVKLIVCGFEEMLVICGQERNCYYLELSSGYLEQIANNLSKFVGYAYWQAQLNSSVLHQYADRIPIELIAERFPNIHYTILNDQLFPLESRVSPSHQIELLRRSRPRQLRIEARLAPEFYDKLTFLDSIKSLRVKTKPGFFASIMIYYEQKTNFKPFEFDHPDHFNSLLKLKNLQSIQMDCAKVPVEFMCKMVKLPFFSEFYLENCSTLSIRITFCQSRYLNGLPDYGPISFDCYLRDGPRNSAIQKQFRELDELVLEIKRIEENEAFKPYLL